jgi:signal transduction histidine kinase
VEIVFTPCPELPTLWGDAVALQTIFERLLDNAIKFSRPLPNQTRPVTIALNTLEDEVRIAFRDEGTGIPAAMHERIFDLFEQHNRGLMEQQGFGMGLTIAKGLVELHNGRIEVASEEGKGSTFTVSLPAHTEHDRSQTAPPNSFHGVPEVASGRIPATILLVEDEISLLHGLADLLLLPTGKYEVNVLAALNGREGLAVLQDHQPDLIISDIMMPQMDGYQFLQAVREGRQWVDIPFIFLTAKNESRDRYEGLRLGVEEYITKPYDTDDLLLFVEKQLDKRFQSQQTVLQDFEGLKRGILNLVTPELMQPLTAVSIHTEKLSKGLEQTYSQEELSTSLREIQTGGLRLNQLIEDLIALAELQTGETAVAYNYHAQPTPNLGPLLFEISQIFALAFPETDIDCPFQDETAMVFGDSRMLLECVQRLLKFAVHYSQTVPETVRLAAKNEGLEVHISLASAIPLQSEAFVHFESALNSDDINLLQLPDYVASLHIVKQYVGLHNGRLTGHNTSETGFRFTIALPIYSPE